MALMKKFRVNADSWTVLADLLVGVPEDFNSDKDILRGRHVTVGLLSELGRLPDAFRAVWHNDKNDIQYAIWSYGTPIAWLTYRNGRKVWVMPKVRDDKGNMREIRYSVTTSKHQNKVRTALSQTSVEKVES